jgi:hypothetical protein
MQPTENPIAGNETARTFIRWALDQQGISDDIDTLTWSKDVDWAITRGTYAIGRDDTLRITAEMYRRWLKGSY